MPRAHKVWIVALVALAPLLLLMRGPPPPLPSSDDEISLGGNHQQSAAPRPRWHASYKPTMESLEEWRIPRWFQGAKFGVFIHWGVYSVPAWAPLKGQFGELPRDMFFKFNPYAEWYYNTMRVPGSPTEEHHKAVYGNRPYYEFADDFEAAHAKWRPEEWGELFADARAAYVVLTSKHHDGYTLWPSKIPNVNAKDFRKNGRLNAKRDLVGELGKALRSHDIFYGIYYSGGIDWTFHRNPILGGSSFPDIKTEEYTAYADSHIEELITRYKPDVLWNDINYPRAANGRLLDLIALYLNSTPTATINNRFRLPIGYFTPEYQVLAEITPRKWETCRGVGYSFSYNQAETTSHVLPVREIVAMLVDIVAKNGNLLLGIGPMANGSIPMMHAQRLREIGTWLKVNGDGIFGSRPWHKWFGYWRAFPVNRDVRVRFTQSEDERRLFAFISISQLNDTHTLAFHCIEAASGAPLTLRLLGHKEPLHVHRESNARLRLQLPRTLPSMYEIAIELEPTPQDLR